MLYCINDIIVNFIIAASASSRFLFPHLNQSGKQFTPVSTLKQHVPGLWDILEFGVDDLLAVLDFNLSFLDPTGEVLLGLLEVLHVVDNDES